MKVLVIGGGGREHAICWKLSQSRSVDKVYCCPGNAGIAQIAECINVNQNDFQSLLDFVKYEWVDLTILGPEDPLSRGIVDLFEKEGRRVLGPTKAGAQLESSKVFCKDLLKSQGIPTAEYKVFTSYVHAEEYVRFKGAPIVIKADGLASGKGVFVASTIEEAFDALRIIMKDRAFGAAGDKVIVEECLRGCRSRPSYWCSTSTRRGRASTWTRWRPESAPGRKASTSTPRTIRPAECSPGAISSALPIWPARTVCG